VTRALAMMTAFALVAMAMTGCVPTEAEGPRTAFDDAIHEVEEAIAAFYLLGPEATVDRVRSAGERLAADWAVVEAAAGGLDDVDLSEANAAHDELAAAIGELADDAKLGSPMRTVMPLLEAFEAAVDEVHEDGDFH